MARRKKGDKISGWVNLEKPQGMTATQALSRVRRILNAQKAGHAGTLDPLATGVLPIALGEATKLIPFVQNASKVYSFTVAWGEERDTDDSDGKVTARHDARPNEDEIERALPRFLGYIQQLPPRYSALKVNGFRAYDLARDGVDFELKPRQVYIRSIELVETFPDEADFRMECGKGTYVRSLARDLAEDLGTYGHIAALRRERVGIFRIQDSISLDILEKMSHSAALAKAVLPLETVLDDIPALNLRRDEAARLRNGQALSFIARLDFERLSKAAAVTTMEERTALATYQNVPVALVAIQGPKIRPLRVLNV